MCCVSVAQAGARHQAPLLGTLRARLSDRRAEAGQYRSILANRKRPRHKARPPDEPRAGQQNARKSASRRKQGLQRQLPNMRGGIRVATTRLRRFGITKHGRFGAQQAIESNAYRMAEHHERRHPGNRSYDLRQVWTHQATISKMGEGLCRNDRDRTLSYRMAMEAQALGAYHHRRTPPRWKPTFLRPTERHVGGA